MYVHIVLVHNCRPTSVAVAAAAAIAISLLVSGFLSAAHQHYFLLDYEHKVEFTISRRFSTVNESRHDERKVDE